ncbi:hypothetical protein AZE42_12107 [Rhizopogon vesiculosus]|uniref:Uncharacterized protein n=1 Tax=Rhizopogon vesiculosus TaxID=180088 RepID=A0A1J8PXP5_9AGAM|nr:hypothetical protein AZE42_12107 [Rhizopogon vesiculosus]
MQAEGSSIQEIQEVSRAENSGSNPPAAAAGPSTSNRPAFTTHPTDVDNDLQDLQASCTVVSVYHYADDERACAAIVLKMSFTPKGDEEIFSFAAIPVRVTGVGISNLEHYPAHDENLDIGSLKVTTKIGVTAGFSQIGKLIGSFSRKQEKTLHEELQFSPKTINEREIRWSVTSPLGFQKYQQQSLSRFHTPDADCIKRWCITAFPVYLKDTPNCGSEVRANVKMALLAQVVVAEEAPSRLDL